ncbi:MAG: hypothetical protein M5U30_06810 [Burkholderiaceae bacterium]|nr:hypothetical protein [Burkholderiaceae bacterium]
MTAQIPDSITVDGRRWVIDEWDGERDCIPANESLGFRTVSPATNNWRGRIDHFLIWHDRLLLFKVEVSLHPDDKGILPFGSRREIVQRYDQLEHWGADGMKMIQRLRECEYLVFDDVNIDFTGSLQLSYPYFDYWDVPWPIAEEDEEMQRRSEAVFEAGRLLDWREYAGR